MTPSSDDLDRVRQTWTRLAEVDPLWAVLSDPGKEGGRWKADEFFQRGEDEIALVLSELDRLSVAVVPGRCLDFGCGVGRLTQALSRRFEAVDGLDIAAPMIDQARAYNRAGDRCRYHVSTDPDLRRFGDGTFDFVYSRIVLQHMPPAAALVYVRDFIRVLRPGGVTVFQVPSEPVVGPLRPGQSRATTALPEEAFRATVELLGLRRTFRPGAVRRLRLQVGNAGPVPWPAAGTADGRFAVRVANQWQEEDGTVVRRDDGRADLPRDVQPEQLVRLPLTVHAPERPGRYRLVLDLVQEGVAWFHQLGSEPLVVPVRVAGRREAPASPPAAAPPAAVAAAEVPHFDMHGIARTEVEEVLREAGADVVAVLDDTSAGPAWVSHLYVATKRQD